MANDFGNIPIGDILAGAPADAAPASDMEMEGAAPEGDDVTGQLELIDPVKIVDFLKAKGILDPEFTMPEGMGMPPEGDMGGFGDVGMDEMAMPPVPVTGIA